MVLSEKHFQVLDALDRHQIHTQRQLAKETGISLGQVNYVLKNLLKKGLVKLGNFRNSPHKISYMYLLTPRGLQAKSKLAASFVMARLKEYNRVKGRLVERLDEIQGEGHSRILFVGPEMAREFVASIIREMKLNLDLTGHCLNRKELGAVDHETFDIALLLEEQGDDHDIDVKGDVTDLREHKIVMLY
ncbi:MAG: MarR family EPS-associated transcriptional regulator [Desulfobacterales bacterium]|nr:MarR family EPS-associated transcriptional regulator [Desulfobacterales bacterium]